ncbi:MAG TPA: multicopper oxidase domain-containing protein [Terriglobales bacterium]|jgi:spore coat protein A
MSVSRRQFLANALASGALPLLPRPTYPTPRTLDATRLSKFVDPLPRPAVAVPIAPGRYRITMRATACQLHRDLPPTICWTYGGSVPGPTIETHSGSPFSVEWRNELPARHFLPIDHTLDGAGPGLPDVRAVVHMHGARVPAASDGYPEDWYVPGHSRLYRYPNRQPAAPLFYHDHAMGVNRLNVYAGLFGLMNIRDEAEDALALPRGEQEIPLVLCDRWLTPDAQLYYPISFIPGKPWVPELFGNAMMVNGKLWPECALAPRAYRLRAVNVANSRFFNLSLASGQPFHLIGTGQGLLPAPVALTSILLAPAERADLIVDFSGHAGEKIVLMNGDIPLMRFRISSGAAAARYRPPERLRRLQRIPERAAVRTRLLTLNQYDDLAANPMTMLLDGKYWHDPVSERPQLGTVEIWSFINLTDDTHPIHLHQARFQILDRRAFDVDAYLASSRLRYLAPARPPGLDERGWKDTARAYAGDVTRIIIPFDGYAGRYLWHCHLLEHEAKDMMRPYDIMPA